MPTNSSSFKQGDVVIASLLFAEQVGTKVRPALVISNSKYNMQSEDFVLLKISSKERMEQYDVPLSNTDLQDGMLQMESKIMIDNPTTAYHRMISRKIGFISETKLNEVKQKIRQFYEI